MFMHYHIGMGVGHKGVWKKLHQKVSLLPPHIAYAASTYASPPPSSGSSPSQAHPTSNSENENTCMAADIDSELLDGTHGAEGGGDDEEFQLDSDMELDEEESVEGDDDYERDVEMFGY